MALKKLHIIGGGLAGSEAAWQSANKDIDVNIYEMRQGEKTTHAHKTDKLAELVCSNSFRASDHSSSAIGLLHEEMRKCDSLIIKCADKNQVPAGGALAVDREGFASSVQESITNHPKINLIRKEITEIPDDWENVIIASGPLSSDNISNYIKKVTGEEYLAFFDALAPIIYKDSIDFSKAWYQSRYDKQSAIGDGKDYINCPMDKQQYDNFIQALIDAEKTEFKEWEKDTPYFNGCLPIEVMAERGDQTLRFGPMKPVGLTNSHNPTQKAYAVVQLRQDNALGTLYNIVGFQTKMKYSAQTRVLRTIPGLENAEFARLGGIHRNTFIKSPILLDQTLRLKNNPKIRFAGQITGVEGYVESAACGLLAGRFATKNILKEDIILPEKTTALGSLLSHITTEENADCFQPMNVNFGLFPPLERKFHKKERKAAYCNRALSDIEKFA